MKLMKPKSGLLILTILVLAAAFARAQTNDLATLLQQGLIEEQANRNLPAAIADYSALARQFDQHRQIAATAIFRLGECYRALGRTNEAAAQYQRILRDFPDQTTLATLSGQNLAGMGMAEIPAGAAMSVSGNSDVALWNKLKALPKPEVEKMLPTLIPDSALTSLVQQRDEAQIKLASLAVDYSTNSLVFIRQKTLVDLLQKQVDERVGGILSALKFRAEIAGSGTANGSAVSNGSTDPESEEIARIRQMIQNSPDLINAPKDGTTPLVNAAYNGWQKVAAYLLDHGANVNTPCSKIAGAGEIDVMKSFGSPFSQITPLMAAVMAGNRTMTQFLIDHGVDVNFQNQGGYSALFMAAKYGFQSVTETLLANHADVNVQNENGLTPLYYAASEKHLNVVQTLLKAGAKVNLGFSPLLKAVQGGEIKVVQALLDAGINVDYKFQVGMFSNATALNSAIFSRSSEMIQALLKAGADPNTVDKQERTPLSYAVEQDDLEFVKMLLAAKADPNGGTLDAPLLVAIHEQNTNAVAWLLQAGANPNAEGKVDWDVFKKGTTRWAAGHPTETPLFLAVSTKQLPMVQLLLKYKADPNDTQTDGRPVLFSAVDDTNILEALLDAGAKVDARDTFSTTSANNRGKHWNWTPLLYAVFRYSPPDSVKILLEHGANPNVKDGNTGETPLHWVAIHNWDSQMSSQAALILHEDMNLLLSHNADPNVRDDSGETPLAILKRQVASNYLSPERKIATAKLADLLRQHGALDQLPDWNGITISRPAANFSKELFQRGTNDWNHFTLLQAIYIYENYYMSKLLFPDLAHVTIVRPQRDSTNATRIAVNLLDATNGIDCARDVPLQFGDVVEIPEMDHALGAAPVGLTRDQSAAIAAYLTGKVTLIVHGEKMQLPVSAYKGYAYGLIGNVLTEPEAQRVLFTSSDLSRVKVIRRDPTTGKTQEWIFDCSNRVPMPDFWLRNGDVIEVPEKP